MRPNSDELPSTLTLRASQQDNTLSAPPVLNPIENGDARTPPQLNVPPRSTDAKHGGLRASKITVAMAEKYEESTDEFVDCEDYAESQAVGIENHAVSGDTDEGPALP
jgi:hypothetical protein